MQGGGEGGAAAGGGEINSILDQMQPSPSDLRGTSQVQSAGSVHPDSSLTFISELLQSDHFKLPTEKPEGWK